MGQQRLLLGLRRFRNQQATVAVRCDNKTCSRIVAQERNFPDVSSVLDRQGAAGVAAVFGVPKRRVDTKAGLSKIDAGLRHGRITES